MDMLLSTLLTFAVGALIGAALTWMLSPARRQHSVISKERDEARQALSRYREEVDEHFLRTADSVNQLTSAYRSVHEQLSEGARKLCSEQGRRLALSRSLDLVGGSDDKVDPSFSPPLDYAPSHKGTLAEDYGHAGKEKDEALTAYDNWEQEGQDGSQPPRDYAEGCDEQGCPPSAEKTT